MTRIAKRQQEAPALSFLDASTQVFREDRMLYQDHLAEQRGQQPRSRPVEKRELPAESTVQEMVAKQMFQHPTMSIMDGWQAVLKAHEGREEFNTVWECYPSIRLVPPRSATMTRRCWPKDGHAHETGHARRASRVPRRPPETVGPLGAL